SGGSRCRSGRPGTPCAGGRGPGPRRPAPPRRSARSATSAPGARRAGGWPRRRRAPVAGTRRRPPCRRWSCGLLPLLGQVGDALTVLRRRAVHRAVDGVTAEEEVEVVLERDADAAVHLYAVLHQLGAVLT